MHNIGALNDTAYISDIRAARAVMDSVLREGLFVRERELIFDHVAHASDVDAWLDHRARVGSRSVLDPQVVERAVALLSDGDGEILIVGKGYAAGLRRP